MRRTTLILFLTLVLCAVLGVLAFSMNPLFREVILTQDVRIVAGSIVSEPDLRGRQFIGTEDSPVSVVAYVNPSNPSTRQFLDEVFPILREYAHNGTITYYPRAVLSLRDIREQNEQFKRMKALICLPAADPAVFEQAYLEFLEGKALNTDPTFSDEDYQGCLHSNETEELWHDAIESERLGAYAAGPQLVIGIDGHDTTVIVGIPSAAKLGREIRKIEIRIGE